MFSINCDPFGGFHYSGPTKAERPSWAPDVITFTQHPGLGRVVDRDGNEWDVHMIINGRVWVIPFEMARDKYSTCTWQPGYSLVYHPCKYRVNGQDNL